LQIYRRRLRSGGKFAISVVYTSGAPLTGEFLREFFEKNETSTVEIIKGFGEDDPPNKPESKNLVKLSLYGL
jgi:hypothetical protein